MDIDDFRSLSYSEKVWHIASNPNAAAFAYDRLKLHRASAVVQMSRTWQEPKGREWHLQSLRRVPVQPN